MAELLTDGSDSMLDMPTFSRQQEIHAAMCMHTVEIQFLATLRITDLPAIHVFYVNPTMSSFQCMRSGLSSINSRNYP